MVLSNKHVLITGGAGFIGSKLTEKLLQKCAKITILDNLSTSKIDNISQIMDQIKFLEIDFKDALSKLKLDEYDCIIHLAANSYVPPSVENPRFDFDENVVKTFMLLDAIRKVPRKPLFLNASSAAIYGSPDILPITERHICCPASPYGVSKLSADQYTTVFSALYSIPAVNLRFFSVYGPKLHKQVIFDLIKKLQKNSTKLDVYGDGTQERDFIYISDLIDAIICIAEKAPAKGEAYNIASGKHYTIHQIVLQICKTMGVTPEIKYTGDVRPGDAQKWIVDTSKLQSLGFSPKISLQEGIDAVVKWMTLDQARL